MSEKDGILAVGGEAANQTLEEKEEFYLLIIEEADVGYKSRSYKDVVISSGFSLRFTMVKHEDDAVDTYYEDQFIFYYELKDHKLRIATIAPKQLNKAIVKELKSLADKETKQ